MCCNFKIYLFSLCVVIERYEEFRCTIDPARKVALWKESVLLADEITVPVDVLTIPELREQPLPIETDVNTQRTNMQPHFRLPLFYNGYV